MGACLSSPSEVEPVEASNEKPVEGEEEEEEESKDFDMFD
jgi:hypothetical protein